MIIVILILSFLCLAMAINLYCGRETRTEEARRRRRLADLRAAFAKLED